MHGFVTPTGRLALWAESTPVEASRCDGDEWCGVEPDGPAGLSGPGTGRAEPHPFAVLPPVDGAAYTATLLLPSVGASPSSSFRIRSNSPY